jgi:hypothetical protein
MARHRAANGKSNPNRTEASLKRTLMAMAWVCVASAAASDASAQMLGTTADRESGISAGAGLYVDRFGFLETRGLSVRGEMPVTSRLSPFAELGLTHFETELASRGALHQSETSALIGLGVKVYGVGEAELGLPVSVSGYTRLQFGLLKNIDLFSAQALALGTWDLTDRLPLLLVLGVGVSYRYTASDGPGETQVTENLTNARVVLGLEAPMNRNLALMAEMAYEDDGSVGIGVKYRL